MYSVPPQLQSAHGLGDHYVAHRPIQYPQLPTSLPPPPALSRGHYTRPEGFLDLNTDLNNNNTTSFIMPWRHRTTFLEDISGCSEQPGSLPVLQPSGPKVRPRVQHKRRKSPTRTCDHSPRRTRSSAGRYGIMHFKSPFLTQRSCTSNMRTNPFGTQTNDILI